MGDLKASKQTNQPYFSCIDTKGVKQFLLSICVSVIESQPCWLERFS